MTLTIARRPAGEDCASILAELPEWFGIPDSNTAYSEMARGRNCWVAERSGETVGVMVLVDTGFAALDIHLMAVRPGAHRLGVGRALFRHALTEAHVLGKPFLTVKTRGPSEPYEPYDRTRAFWSAVGFAPLEEFTTIWGPQDPCLIMVMAVSTV